MTINNLFAENTNGVEITNSRSLSGTARLTNMAMELGNKVMAYVDNGITNEETAEETRTALHASQKDHLAMDALIDASGVLENAEVAWINELEETVIDGMLKSQQSKRSRAKGKVMTKENYMAMLTGAIAENLIRLATGKEKQAARRSSGETNYTDEALKLLADDQDKLRRELRNIQSKKSIMKSKEGFSEKSDAWQSLLRAEKALKNIRIAGATGGTKTIEVDTTKNALIALFSDNGQNTVESFDPNRLNKKQLVEFVEQIKELALVTEPVAETDTPDDNSGDSETETE